MPLLLLEMAGGRKEKMEGPELMNIAMSCALLPLWLMSPVHDGGDYHEGRIWLMSPITDARVSCPGVPFVYPRQFYLLLQHWCEVEQILVPFY